MALEITAGRSFRACLRGHEIPRSFGFPRLEIPIPACLMTTGSWISISATVRPRCGSMVSNRATPHSGRPSRPDPARGRQPRRRVAALPTIDGGGLRLFARGTLFQRHKFRRTEPRPVMGRKTCLAVRRVEGDGIVRHGPEVRERGRPCVAKQCSSDFSSCVS